MSLRTGIIARISGGSATKMQLLSLLKFGLVGGLTAAIFFLVMWIALNLFFVGNLYAVSAGYFISTLFHYLANKHITFVDKSGYGISEVLRYAVVWFVNYCLTLGIVGFCNEVFGTNPYIAVLLSLFLTTSMSFLLLRYWVFNSKKERL